MFYNKKYLFVVVSYLMNFILCLLINKCFIFLGMNFNIILGSIIIYIIILTFCSIVSLILVYLFKIFKWVFKLKKRKIESRFFWNIFSISVYLCICSIFFKITEY
jgi:hypothetical protein